MSSFLTDRSRAIQFLEIFFCVSHSLTNSPKNEKKRNCKILLSHSNTLPYINTSQTTRKLFDVKQNKLLENFTREKPEILCKLAKNDVFVNTNLLGILFMLDQDCWLIFYAYYRQAFFAPTIFVRYRQLSLFADLLFADQKTGENREQQEKNQSFNLNRLNLRVLLLAVCKFIRNLTPANSEGNL